METPIPNDLMTGKPFHYEVNGEERATLSAQGIPTGEREIGEIRYHIKMGK